MKHTSATTLWQLIQRRLSILDDGIPANQTANAVAKALGVVCPCESSIWPYDTDRDLQGFYGRPGIALTNMDMPFPLRLAWQPDRLVHGVTVHRKVLHPMLRIWRRVLEHYGHEQIKSLGLDLYGGCYNQRKKRGGSSWSVHAFAAAWDVDPDNNQLRWTRDKARLATPPYEAFWNIVEDEGAISLGRAKNYDWMHFQFAIPS